MKGAALAMILYSFSMVFFGALEMGHDLLHYFAEHHHSHVHDHDHKHYHSHSIRDHHIHHAEHNGHHHSDAEGPNDVNPTMGFFLFIESSIEYKFNSPWWVIIPPLDSLHYKNIDSSPSIPPPRIAC